jgi:diguanylate cyclase (GGDEF)-like protein
LNIAERLTLGFVVTALLMGALASMLSGVREYDIQVNNIVATASNQLRGRPDLQFHIYRRDAGALETALESFLEPDAVSSAIAYSNMGEQLAVVQRPGATALASAPFSRVRGDLLTVDSDFITFTGDGSRAEPGLFSLLLSPRSPIYHTQPVFSLVNPGDSRLTEADFAMALTSAERSNSQWVIGYLHLLVDRRTLLAAVLPAVGTVFFNVVIIVALCAVAGWYVTRRMTRPLRELSHMADRLAAGELDGPLQIEGGAQMQEFIQVINSFLGGLNNVKTARDVDKRLLSLKVEERNSQLSERARELDEAVQEMEQARSRLERIAHYDPLTQLPNRRLFTEQLDLLLKLNQRNKSTLALLFIDLDDFKRINESLGLSVGDRLLQRVAKRLTEALRDSDNVGHFANSTADIAVSRLDGDEFTVILNQVKDVEAAQQVADRIATVLAEPVIVGAHELIVRPGIGVALAPAHATEVEPLLRAASIAKQRARHALAAERICIYHPDMAHTGETRMRLAADLRRAIERDQLVLHYQPQVDCHSGSVIGAEALLRWNHPDHGLVPPGDFVRLAEDIGYMDTLGDWVLVEACRQLRQLNDAGAKLPRIAINVSAAQFHSRFVTRVDEVLAETGVPASQLELGLAEGIMTRHNADTEAALRSLKDSGVYLAVDDFGTGYSPLAYLGQYPLDELKISRHLLWESDRSENGAKLLVAIIAMARSLDLKLLATGVETEAQFRFLTENGIRLLQGYLLSEPVPAEQLPAVLSPWHFMDRLQQLSRPPSSARA